MHEFFFLTISNNASNAALVGILVKRFTTLSVFKSPHLSPLFYPTFFSFSFRIFSSFSAFFSCSCNPWMRKSLSGQQLLTKNSASGTVVQFREFAVVSGAVAVFSDTCVRVIGYFLFHQYIRNFFAAFLCFSGLLFRDNFGPIRWVLSLSSHNFRVDVVSQILCWVGIFICRLAVFKMYAAHSRRILWSPNFSFPYFPFNILRPSSSSFAILFLRGKGKKLEWWLAVAGMCPVQTCMNSAGLFRPFIQLFSAVWAANNNTTPVPKSHT